MDNDLISRSELKKAIEPFRYAICGFEGVLALIDNAPAVESGRPQGVWMPVREEAFGVVRFRCSNCGFEVYCPASQIRNYKGCFCGAEMEVMQNEID